MTEQKDKPNADSMIQSNAARSFPKPHQASLQQQNRQPMPALRSSSASLILTKVQPKVGLKIPNPGSQSGPRLISVSSSGSDSGFGQSSGFRPNSRWKIDGGSQTGSQIQLRTPKSEIVEVFLPVSPTESSESADSSIRSRRSRSSSRGKKRIRQGMKRRSRSSRGKRRSRSGRRKRRSKSRPRRTRSNSSSRSSKSRRRARSGKNRER